MADNSTTKPLLIYLADPTHDGTGRIAVEIFPYNIGLVASYAKKVLGDAVEIKLFKYVGPLLAALKDRPPDILGCSNYTWNSQLSHFLCERAKQQNPNILTVQGGTNYPFAADGQLEFLSQRPFVDFHVSYEGEKAFVNLIKSCVECRDVKELRERPVDGCQSISPTTRRLITGIPVPRTKNLDEVPSPYVTGLLDDFFDGQLIPLLETNRGCPFMCNFCNAGEDYYKKVNQFSTEYLRQEWHYIAPRIVEAGVTTVVFADNNFGMYPRDAELCRMLKELQEEYGWPKRIISTTGKNHKKRIIEATEILGPALSINISAQSMDPTVLKHIKRSNVSLDVYKEVNDVLLKEGRIQKGELIACLPGETFETFMSGLRQMMECGAQQIYNYTLQLLYGTEYKDLQYRERWGYVGKWRIVPQDFGEYDGRRIFDVEEVAVKSKTISFDDYLKIRIVCLLTEAMYNEYQYYEFIKYLNEISVSPLDWIWKTLNSLRNAPEAIRGVIESFVQDTKDELFESEEELFEFYRYDDNYQKLLRGEAGHNVVFTHKGLLIGQHLDKWISFIAQMCFAVIVEQGRGEIDSARVELETHALEKFLRAKWNGVLNSSASVEDIMLETDYDVLGWLQDASGKRLAEFKLEEPAIYRYYFAEAQLKQREEDMKRYGYDRVGLAKLYARGVSYDPFRHVERIAHTAQLA